MSKRSAEPEDAAAPARTAARLASAMPAEVGPPVGGSAAQAAVGKVLRLLQASWAKSGDQAAEACAPLLEAALTQPMASPWADLDGLRCPPPAGLAEELCTAAASEAAGGLEAILKAFQEGLESFAWKTPKQLLSPEMRPKQQDPQELEQLLGGRDRFKSAMLVGSARWGASFASEELLLGLTWLAPGTLYPTHAHDATEVYQMILGAGCWGPTREHLEAKPPGAFLLLPSATPHTIRAPESSSLLAVYAWTGQLSGKFWFCDCIAGASYVKDIASVVEPEEYYDKMAADYEAVVRGWGYCMPEAAVDALASHGSFRFEQAGRAVLDLGCGDGLVGTALRGRGLQSSLVGLDLSAAMLEEAEKRDCYSQLQKADLSKSLTFADGIFDALLCVGTTTYLPPAMLEDWLRVLAPGGLMVLTHKTVVMEAWERTQEDLATKKALEVLWRSEPLHYLPSLQAESKLNPDERARVYVLRKPHPRVKAD